MTNQLAYLVDMTKAEDLYLMGENKKSLGVCGAPSMSVKHLRQIVPNSAVGYSLTFE